jgi:hypothetical protein
MAASAYQDIKKSLRQLYLEDNRPWRTSRGCAPINSATCARAVSITDFIFAPNLYALDGLPHSVVRYGITASNTSGSTGVVALWSR